MTVYAFCASRIFAFASASPSRTPGRTGKTFLKLKSHSYKVLSETRKCVHGYKVKKDKRHV